MGSDVLSSQSFFFLILADYFAPPDYSVNKHRTNLEDKSGWWNYKFSQS